jgi:hypothetical protein
MTDPLSIKLEKLRIQYVRSLPDKVREITLLVKQLNTNKWNNKKQETLITLVHRMVGSGKTFEVKGLTECAFTSEKLLLKKLSVDRVISMATRKKIDRYVDRLKKISREAAGNKSPGNKKKRLPEQERRIETGIRMFFSSSMTSGSP